MSVGQLGDVFLAQQLLHAADKEKNARHLHVQELGDTLQNTQALDPNGRAMGV